jgi:bis(5'-nucleosidyl)-tetraphosphatase
MIQEKKTKPVYEQSAGFIIFREDKKGKRFYLLLHYPGGHFDFPKGHVEKGETKYQAAARELEEETGIKKVDWVENFKDKIHYYYQHNGRLMSKDVFFYLARTKQKNVTISFEHQGFFWLPYEEARQKITYQNSRGLLEKAEALLQKKIQ